MAPVVCFLVQSNVGLRESLALPRPPDKGNRTGSRPGACTLVPDPNMACKRSGRGLGRRALGGWANGGTNGERRPRE